MASLEPPGHQRRGSLDEYEEASASLLVRGSSRRGVAKSVSAPVGRRGSTRSNSSSGSTERFALRLPSRAAAGGAARYTSDDVRELDALIQDSRTRSLLRRAGGRRDGSMTERSYRRRSAGAGAPASASSSSSSLALRGLLTERRARPGDEPMLSGSSTSASMRSMVSSSSSGGGGGGGGGAAGDSPTGSRRLVRRRGSGGAETLRSVSAGSGSLLERRRASGNFPAVSLSSATSTAAASPGGVDRRQQQRAGMFRSSSLRKSPLSPKNSKRSSLGSTGSGERGNSPRTISISAHHSPGNSSAGGSRTSLRVTVPGIALRSDSAESEDADSDADDALYLRHMTPRAGYSAKRHSSGRLSSARHRSSSDETTDVSDVPVWECPKKKLPPSRIGWVDSDDDVPPFRVPPRLAHLHGDDSEEDRQLRQERKEATRIALREARGVMGRPSGGGSSESDDMRRGAITARYMQRRPSDELRVRVPVHSKSGDEASPPSGPPRSLTARAMRLSSASPSKHARAPTRSSRSHGAALADESHSSSDVDIVDGDALARDSSRLAQRMWGQRLDTPSSSSSRRLERKGSTGSRKGKVRRRSQTSVGFFAERDRRRDSSGEGSDEDDVSDAGSLSEQRIAERRKRRASSRRLLRQRAGSVRSIRLRHDSDTSESDRVHMRDGGERSGSERSGDERVKRRSPGRDRLSVGAERGGRHPSSPAAVVSPSARHHRSPHRRSPRRSPRDVVEEVERGDDAPRARSGSRVDALSSARGPEYYASAESEAESSKTEEERRMERHRSLQLSLDSPLVKALVTPPPANTPSMEPMISPTRLAELEAFAKLSGEVGRPPSDSPVPPPGTGTPLGKIDETLILEPEPLRSLSDTPLGSLHGMHGGEWAPSLRRGSDSSGLVGGSDPALPYAALRSAAVVFGSQASSDVESPKSPKSPKSLVSYASDSSLLSAGRRGHKRSKSSDDKIASFIQMPSARRVRGAARKSLMSVGSLSDIDTGNLSAGSSGRVGKRSHRRSRSSDGATTVSVPLPRVAMMGTLSSPVTPGSKMAEVREMEMRLKADKEERKRKEAEGTARAKRVGKETRKRQQEAQQQLRDDLKTARKHMKKERKEARKRARAIIHAWLRGWVARRRYPQLLAQARARLTIRAWVLGWAVRRRVRKLRTCVEKRTFIAREMLSTEESYVHALDTVQRELLNPLRTAVHKGKPILKGSAIKEIFSDIEIIASVHAQLLADIKARMETWDGVATQLGDVFMHFVGFFKVYVPYINNYNNALTSLAKARRRKEFVHFLAQSRDKCEGLDIYSLLIMPVQRIPRYALLLEDLVRHTSPYHRDYAALSDALAHTKQVAEYMNEKKRHAESIMHIVEIQERLGHKIELVSPTRRFVREGALSIFDVKNRPKPVVVFLFNDLIVLAQQKRVGNDIKFREAFPLRELTLLRLQSEDVPHAFLINLRGAPSTPPLMYLQAESDEAAHEWVTVLTSTLSLAHRGPAGRASSVTNEFGEVLGKGKAKALNRMSLRPLQSLEQPQPPSPKGKRGHRRRASLSTRLGGTLSRALGSLVKKQDQQ